MGRAPVSTPAAAAHTSARSAPSSTCRVANHATARRTTSSISCASVWAQGIHKFFITDDNFARNKEWESIFHRLIELREEHGIPLGLLIQVDTLCHKIPNFIAKAKRAGVTKVFIGLENINPDNLIAAKKRQNKITEYRKMLLAWKAQGIITFAGYILGFPADTPETIRRDIEIIKNELPIDLLDFFPTPLPGSEDHQVLWKNGVVMDSDLNKYDTEHACTPHTRMSEQEWQRIIYPRGLVARLHSGAHDDPPAPSSGDRSADTQHRKVPAPHTRRPGSPRARAPAAGGNSPPQTSIGAPARLSARARLDFLAALRLGHAQKARNPAGTIGRLLVWATAIARDPEARAYMDQALTPVGDDEDATLDLLTKTTGRAGTAHGKKVAELTGVSRVA